MYTSSQCLFDIHISGFNQLNQLIYSYGRPEAALKQVYDKTITQLHNCIETIIDSLTMRVRRPMLHFLARHRHCHYNHHVH